tara:strand:+ start:1542 stop:2477 length:936 start_codon:yes stop_codon:yes gene_type:complete
VDLPENGLMSKKDTRAIFNTVPIKKTHRQKLMEKINRAEVEPLKDQKRVVTTQQWKFIKELCNEDGKPVSLREAAIRAGYSAKNATKCASELTSAKKYPHVVAAIQEYRYELGLKYGTSYEQHMQDLLLIRNQALEAGNYGAAVSAEFRRGQALGTIYIERKEIRHGTIDSMSKEDVKRKLEEIKALYGGLPPPQQILDITPEQIEDTEPTLLEAMRNDERARRLAPPKTQGQSSESSDSQAREPSESGPPGLSDSPASEGLSVNGIKGSEGGEENTTITASSSFRHETQSAEDADVHSCRVASEGDAKEE